MIFLSGYYVHIASQNGHTQVIEILLREHADISIQSKKGLTALTIASLNGHTEVVEIFLKKQLDINSQREDRVTALILASQNGYHRLLNYSSKSMQMSIGREMTK